MESILFKDNKAITEEGDAFFDNYNNYGKGTVNQDLPVDESGICLDTNYVSDDSGHSENEAAVEPEAKKRKVAWIDEDDAQEFSLDTKRGRQVVDGGQYEALLRERQERAFGTAPDWADLDSKEAISDDEDAIVIGKSVFSDRRLGLVPHHLKYSFVSDLTKHRNEACRAKQDKQTFRTEFARSHPIACVTSVTKGQNVKNVHGQATLYHVDADECELRASFVFERFPVSCSALLYSDQKLVVAGHYKGYLHVVDLATGKKSRVPWMHNEFSQEKKELKAVAPNTLLLNEKHCLRLLDTRSWRPTELFRPANPISATAVSSDGSTIYSHSYQDARVHLWDVRSSNCLGSFIDEGCVHGAAIAASPDGRWLACGSDAGIVNVYDVKAAHSPSPNGTVVPSKVLTNLRTEVSTLEFNHDSQALCFASDKLNTAVKLAHFPSMTVFSNFPSLKDRVSVVYHAAFSPNGAYLALATKKNAAHAVRRVRLQYYQKY